MKKFDLVGFECGLILITLCEGSRISVTTANVKRSRAILVELSKNCIVKLKTGSQRVTCSLHLLLNTPAERKISVFVKYIREDNCATNLEQGLPRIYLNVMY